MEAICSSETSVDTQRTTRRYISDIDTLHYYNIFIICCAIIIIINANKLLKQAKNEKLINVIIN
jgi:hypothetical protein